MSRFDLPEHRFLHQEQLRGKQLKKIEPDKQDKNQAEHEPIQEESFERVFDTFEQAVEASAQEITASINKALLRAKVGSDGLLSPKSVNVHSKLDTSNLTRIIDLIPTLVNDTHTVVNPDTPPDVPTPPDDTEDTTITNEELYADREKYSQEFVNSLNIGLEAETFSSVLNTYFQEITINGEGVYILRSVTLTQVKDLISQIYVTEKLTTAPDYLPNPPDENGGYALTNQTTYDNRKANYYYMCYLNGISCTGHEFEDGTFNRDIARQCGLYDYQDVFANYLEEEGVQKYLQENFGITVSTPPSEEYIELWDKLANLAAIGENGKNTGEYNTQNVLKYFGLALTDQQFMSFINKASYAQNENSITNNTSDIEAVKSVIAERYPELLENSEVLTDEFIEWIGSNAFEFLQYNQSKLRANGLQKFVNYGNIPSWITFNNGTEFNEELLMKCCIQATAELAEMGVKLGFDPQEFVNENLSEFVEEIYFDEIANLEGIQEAGGPRRAPSNQNMFESVLNFLRQKYGQNVTYINGLRSCCEFYINNEFIGVYYSERNKLTLSKKYREQSGSFNTITDYTFNNGEAVPNYKFDCRIFLSTYYLESSSPSFICEHFPNGISDLCEYLKNANFSDLCEIMSFLARPDENKSFWNDVKSQIFNDTEMYSYLQNILENKLQKPKFTDLYNMLQDSCGNGDLTYLYYSIITRERTSNRIFVNPNETAIVQGRLGNCWLVSFALGPEISNLITKYCVNHDEKNGIYTVTIQGKTYTYTDAQIAQATELSYGNDNIKAFEMAARDFYGIDGKNPLYTGGNMGEALELLTGYNCSRYYDIENELLTILEHIKSGKFQSQLGVDRYAIIFAIDERTGETVKLADHHAYNIKNADNEYIYIEDPHGKRYKLAISDFVNHSSDLSYSDASIDTIEHYLIVANGIADEKLSHVYGILEGGNYLDENGNFNYQLFYQDCKYYGINYFNFSIKSKLVYDENGRSAMRLEFYDKSTGIATTVIYHDNNTKEIIQIHRPTVIFIDNGEEGCWSSIREFLFGTTDEQLANMIPGFELFKNPDGSVNRGILERVLEYCNDDGLFDSEVLSIIINELLKNNNSSNAEDLEAILSELGSYENVAKYANNIQELEMLQQLRSQNAQTAIYALQDWVEERLAKIKASGSIYNEMSFWDFQDVLTNPFCTTEDYIAAINAMNSIINAAKSIGVSLDAYIHMNPAERQRRMGMLTTPIDYSIFTNPWVNFVPVEWDEGNNIYYSTPNQSSCFEAPDWFKEYLENGGTLDNYEIGLHLLEDDYTEAEEKLYLERQHYEFWIMKNGSLLTDLPPTERYSIYLMDMMHFSMWLCTDAIMQGYTKDEYDWESLYEVYCDSEIKPF